MALNPLLQFEIKPMFPVNVMGVDLTITNQAFWMLVAVGFVGLLLFVAGRRPKLIPGRFQSFVEVTHGFVHGLVKDTAGSSGLAYLPLIMALFLFIAILNLFGMIPGTFTSTSQIFLTGYLALGVFLLVIIVGFMKQGLGFLGIFYPQGTPMFMAPLVVPLEIISFLARPLTLAVRLAANMIAGHVLLKVFASFAVMLLGVFSLASLAPLVMLIAISGLEIFVAVLQAYIFTILACVYLHDALHGH